MTEDRVYRKALPREAAISEIRKNAGAQFDPNIAKVFLENLEGQEILLTGLFEKDLSWNWIIKNVSLFGTKFFPKKFRRAKCSSIRQ
jgi:HD-GYP domain-containing protein (c-di-GMP phosphodiesterase class II)